MTGKDRSPALPDLPTVDEAGMPGIYFYFWHAIWVPKGTPKDVIAKLNEARDKAVADPVTRKRLVEIGQEFFPTDMSTPEALAKFQKRRDREVVAGDQGAEHQGALAFRLSFFLARAGRMRRRH